MGKSGRDRIGRGGKRYDGRVSDNARWEPKEQYHDPCRDLGDLYDEVQDSVSEEFVWPEYESEEDN